MRPRDLRLKCGYRHRHKMEHGALLQKNDINLPGEKKTRYRRICSSARLIPCPVPEPSQEAVQSNIHSTSGRGQRSKYVFNVDKPEFSFPAVHLYALFDVAGCNNCTKWERMLFQIFISRMIESRGAAAVCTDEKCSITQRTQESMRISAANRLIGDVVQSRRRPLLGPSPGWKRLLALSHLRRY